MAGVISATNGINFPDDGFVIRPIAVDKITRKSALPKEASKAERTSLSPNFISSSLIESFSLIIGTTPLSARELRVS